MPKSPAAPPVEIELDGGLPTATPEPAEHLHVALTELAPGTVLHRVHLSEYQADQFNPGIRGNARFSPVQDDKGKAIPALYAARHYLAQ